MKKKITFLAAALLFALISQAQILKKGNVIFDGYYGFPNLYGTVIKDWVNNTTDLKLTSTGPLGLKTEYLLADKTGLGINAFYSDAKLAYKLADDSTNTEYGIKEWRYDVLLMFNYHFVNTESLDSYFCVGAGYHNREFKWIGDEDETIEFPFKIPFNFRIGVGLRYFITENFGLNFEFGTMGPLVCFGLSGKF